MRAAVFHGGVGNIDAETVLLRSGYQPLRLGDEYAFGPAAKWRRLRAAWRWQRAMPQGATIVFQWPLYAALHRRLLRHFARRRPDLRLVCFLTDINGLKDGNERLLRQELHYLEPFNTFIVHNQRMHEWLHRQRPDAEIAGIEFFDFLAEPCFRPRSPEPELCFAGALDKSPFLRKLERYPELKFHLYGPGHETVPNLRNCQYEGTFPAPELPQRIEGSFGLVWDGDSDQGLGGPLGEYARYISPHKLSLYVLAGLPIICHEASAAAGLVEKYGIGFSVQSLAGVAAPIRAITPEQYAEMVRNTAPLADRISTGQCLLGALNALG